jgi:hypothetical protein
LAFDPFVKKTHHLSEQVPEAGQIFLAFARAASFKQQLVCQCLPVFAPAAFPIVNPSRSLFQLLAPQNVPPSPKSPFSLSHSHDLNLSSLFKIFPFLFVVGRPLKPVPLLAPFLVLSLFYYYYFPWATFFALVQSK